MAHLPWAFVEAMSVTPLDRRSDEELALCAAGNRDCVETFVARYEEKIRACAWRMVGDPDEIEDLTQETLLRLIRSLPSYRGEASASTWVYRIAHNTCVDAHRRRAARPQSVPLEPDEVAGAEAPAELELDPAALFEDAAAECFVEHAVRELPPEYSRIASLRLLDGLSNEEIADRLGTSVDAVKSKVKRARARLRERLAEPHACPLCPPGELRFGAEGLS
jgi:RNA polymerase sigma-70 factor (ECF subfamily)